MTRVPTPPRGRRRRADILTAAVDVASVEGLEGLTIGRLADHIVMSKSGLFAHFGSKQELQLATLDRAAEVFQQRVLAPVLEMESGAARLRALVEGWLTYVEKTEYRGGCFFAAASAEFSGRTGPVRNRLAALTGRWLLTLEREARTAKRVGELATGVDPARLAFQFHAFVQEANWAREILRDADAFVKARAAIDDVLTRAAAAPVARRKGR